jgi:hypothetical protein
MLLGDDSDSEVKIKINENYAGHYNSWRQKEELQKRKFVELCYVHLVPFISLCSFSHGVNRRR